MTDLERAELDLLDSCAELLSLPPGELDDALAHLDMFVNQASSGAGLSWRELLAELAPWSTPPP